MATGWSDLSPLGQAGIISQGFGTIGGMVGSYYAAKSEQNKTKDNTTLHKTTPNKTKTKQT